MKNKNQLNFSILGFFLFFITIAGTSSTSVIVFQVINKASNGNLTAIILGVLGNILLGTIICVGIDIVRRKIMVDKPTKIILDATNEIAKGNFKIKLKIKNKHSKYDEYDKIKENINKMAEELSKNEVLKSDFISNVSHEIKTPLAIIQNYTTILQDDNLKSSDKKKYLETIVTATKKLSNLITNILKLNKLENQKLDFKISKFNLGEELRLCVLEYENLFDKKNLQLNCDIPDIYITSSKELLEIVWNNLISNAIKFTNNGGKIDISLIDKDNTTSIIIADNGCGMSRDIGKHIFDKFYQGDSSHASDGNGLGLALVKKVIDILGGEITVESELNKGSTFTIKLKRD